jgi:hypothetical protein
LYQINSNQLLKRPLGGDRVETKIFVFVLLREVKKNVSAFRKKSLQKVVQIFLLEYGSGFRSTLNVYPDPKQSLKTFEKKETFRENHSWALPE